MQELIMCFGKSIKYAISIQIQTAYAAGAARNFTALQRGKIESIKEQMKACFHLLLYAPGPALPGSAPPPPRMLSGFGYLSAAVWRYLCRRIFLDILWQYVFLFDLRKYRNKERLNVGDMRKNCSAGGMAPDIFKSKRRELRKHQQAHRSILSVIYCPDNPNIGIKRLYELKLKAGPDVQERFAAINN